MAYKTEKKIIIGSWISIIYLLFRFVPKDKIREALIAFHIKQVMTWIFGLFVVEKKLISYPYRLFFRKSNKSSFTFEYFVYPALCTFFNIYYPENKNIFLKAIYYSFYSSIITIFEIFATGYTKLIHYKNWTWYWSFITTYIVDYLSHLYYRWFFKVR